MEKTKAQDKEMNLHWADEQEVIKTNTPLVFC